MGSKWLSPNKNSRHQGLRWAFLVGSTPYMSHIVTRRRGYHTWLQRERMAGNCIWTLLGLCPSLPISDFGLYSFFVINCSHEYKSFRWVQSVIRGGSKALWKLKYLPLILSFKHFLAFGTKRCLSTILCFPYPSPEIPFLQGTLVLFTGEWYSETKIWAQVCSLLLGCQCFLTISTNIAPQNCFL